MTARGLIYRGLGRLRGPYASVDAVPGAAFHEMVELDGGDGRTGPREDHAMTGAATRWRLIELQRRRRAIDTGIELLASGKDCCAPWRSVRAPRRRCAGRWPMR